VRVEIGQKPGVVRGTGSSNPSPSSKESRANLISGAMPRESAFEAELADVKVSAVEKWRLRQRAGKICGLLTGDLSLTPP
jgi:hypothetical protein